MPTRHGITVSIVEPSPKLTPPTTWSSPDSLKSTSSTKTPDKPFTEYDLQTFNSKSKLCSTKIEARANKQFYIHIKTVYPFPWDETEKGVKTLNPSHQQFNAPRYGKDEVKVMDWDDGGMGVGANTRAKAKAKENPPPFALAVFVYMDGRSEPECRNILHLAPNNSHWQHKPEGWKLDGRWEAPRDARGRVVDNNKVQVKGWVFNAHGELESVFDKLDVNAADPVIPDEEEVEMGEMVEKLKESEVNEESRGKAGVIKVVFKRILVKSEERGRKHKDVYARDLEEEEIGDVGADVDHLTSVKKEGKEITLYAMQWEKYKDGEDMFAEFQFQYMGRSKLVNMGLSEQDGTPRKKGDKKRNTTPVTPVILEINKRDADSDEEDARKMSEKKARNSKVSPVGACASTSGLTGSCSWHHRHLQVGPTLTTSPTTTRGGPSDLTTRAFNNTISSFSQFLTIPTFANWQ